MVTLRMLLNLSSFANCTAKSLRATITLKNYSIMVEPNNLLVKAKTLLSPYDNFIAKIVEKKPCDKHSELEFSEDPSLFSS